ncbi:MAG: metal-dependent hydrolase [Candidatus Nanoarchaeia archaeon]
MLGATHLLFSFFFGSLFFKFISANTLINKIIFTIVLLIGTFLPDLDIKLKLKHRGYTHTIWPVILALIFGGVFSKVQFIALTFALGYGSHLFVDMLTPFGIAPFLPIYKRKISGPIETGSILEFGIVIALLILIFFA